MQATRVERQIGGRTLAIETGFLAKLADGAVTVQFGDTVVLAAVVRANPREGIDFFPLQVDYRERRAAAFEPDAPAQSTDAHGVSTQGSPQMHKPRQWECRMMNAECRI